MFGFLTAAIENTFDIADGLVEGKTPSKRQIAKLVDAGITLWAISEATGIAVDVLEQVMEE